MIQGLIVAGIVLFCLWQVVKTFWPARTAAKTPEGGCGSGCDTCGSCSAAGHLAALVEKELHPAE